MSQLPAATGVGFKPEHFASISAGKPPVGFFEVHAENYMGAGGLPHAQLTALRADYALSIHGVGLSIGGARGLDVNHLRRLRTLCDRYQPESFSEHLAWSSHGADYLNDLLPLPYTEETLNTVAAHVDQLQDALARRILLEKWVRYSFIANALVTPLISIVYFHPVYSTTLLYIGMPWGITAPLFMLMLALMLRRRGDATPADPRVADPG